MKKNESGVQVKKKLAWSAVPDLVLVDSKLSWRARVVLGWMLGRPDGWVLYVTNIQNTFKLSPSQWLGIKRELVAAGFFRQVRKRGDGGVFEWANEVTDQPLHHPNP